MGILDAPVVSNASRHAAALTQRLALGVDDAALLVLGDSTGAGTSRWVYLLTQWLATQFPAYTVNYWQWNDTAQNYDALGTASSSAVMQTGTGRTATGNTTNASPTVAATSIKAVDLGRPVSGAGIPANSFVGTVTDSTSFLLSSSPTSQANVTATATASGVTLTLGARKLDVYNGSFSGSLASYPMATSTRWPLIAPVTPQCVIINYGHNHTTIGDGLVYRQQAYPLCRKVQESFPNAGVILTLQNPRSTTDSGTGFAAERANDLSRQAGNALLAASEGYGVVNVLQRFLNDPNYEANLGSTDGLHPQQAGNVAWAEEVKRHFRTSLGVQPTAPPVRATWQFLPATSFVGEAGVAPTLTAPNSAPVLSYDQDTQQSAVATFDIPPHWQAYDVYTIWTTAAGAPVGSSGVRWGYASIGLGSFGFSPPIDAVVGFPLTISSETQAVGNTLTSGTFSPRATLLVSGQSGIARVKNRPLSMRIRRIAADPTDTLAAPALLYGVLLVRAA